MATARKTAAPAAARKATPRKAAAPVIPVDRPVKLDRLADDIAALRKLEAQAKRINDRKTPIVARIKDAMGDATQGLVAGTPVVRWPTTVRRTISSKLVRDKYPDVAAACETLSQVRTFQLIDPAQ